MRPYQRFVVGEIIIGCIKTEVGISNGGTRHVDAVNDLLKEGRGVVVGVDVVNDEGRNGEKKSKMHSLFNPRNQHIT